MGTVFADRGTVPPPAADISDEWHTLAAKEVQDRLESGPDGLNAAEVRRRVKIYGSNQLEPCRRQSPVLRFIRQFHNILLYVMTGAAVVTAVLQHWVDTAVLLAAVVINAVIAFVQEGKAEAAMDAIRAMLSPHARVVRDGCTVDIDAAELVPGDVVKLAAGDRVPADLRLISVDGLRVDESALTGESVPVQKSTATADVDTAIGDRSGMAYSGTLVVHGQATGLVVGTGAQTEIGVINRLLTGISPTATPLLRQINSFGRVLAIVILGLSTATYAIGVLWRGESVSDMFMMAVALAASAIPEGLPAIMTVTLAIGVQRMSRRRAIIRRLPAVEALGSVTVICSDKTGTLTSNEMTVQRVVCGGRDIGVDGVGYTPVGDFRVGGRAVDPAADATLLNTLRAGVLCNDAALNEEGSGWAISGDPTEAALLVAAMKAGLRHDSEQLAQPRAATVPFESENRLMGTLHMTPEGVPLIVVKGAPERVLDICGWQWAPNGVQPIDRDHWRQQAAGMGAQGLRVLALAQRRAAPRMPDVLDIADLASDFTMLGLVGITDPLRPEAITAVQECHRAGIRVTMITGDHAATAAAIGAQLGIGAGKPAVTGAQIAAMDELQLRAAAQDSDVFARASPEHKLRLVRALQANGEIVAMTGDGVNDSPALKKADIGIAMGRKGTEAAKEASDMVLADDNFATIAAAVAEGRTVYDNIRKFVMFMLPTNGGEALVVIAAIMFQITLPLTPAQVLWINLATSGTLGLALAFEPPEKDVMARRPRPSNESLLSRHFAWRVALVSVLMAAGALGMFLWELSLGTGVETARTMAVNAIVVAEMFYLLNNRSLFASVLNRTGLFGNKIALLTVLACALLQLAFTYTPVMNAIIGSTPLGYSEWLKAIAVGVAVFAVVEIEKLVVRRRRAGASQRIGASR